MIYCGVDGGGSKTKIVIAKDENIIEVIDCGPTSVDTVSFLEMQKTIEDALEKFYQDRELEKIDVMYLGLGGIATDSDIQKVNKLVSEIKYLKADAIINSGNDITNAYKSSCSGRNNITLIIGTGSVVYGIDETGKSHRTSGIHFKEGDFGSGYDLGVRALKYMSYRFDERIESSEFVDYLLAKFEIEGIGSLITFFDKYKMDRTFIASLARDVIDFYNQNDKYAIKILDEATDEIMLMIKAVDKKIDLVNREIGVIGGLGSCNAYFNLLEKKVLTYDSKFNMHVSEHSAEIGSLMIAKDLVSGG